MAPERQPEISIRHSIRWLPNSTSSSDNFQPSEPTSTIVLTSPAGRFVDLRILKEDASSPDHTSVFINPTPTSSTPTLPLSRLDWAIAGTSSYTPTRPTIGYYGQKLILPDGRTVNGSYADLKSGKQPYTRGRWTHWIDSRVPCTADDESSKESGDDDAEADEGDMYRVPDNEKLTLEKGVMENPATGKEEGYEEIWGEDFSSEDGEKVECVVWECDDKKENKKSRVVRVGRWAQGILRRGNEVVCERWKVVGGEWRLEVSVGGCIGGEEGQEVGLAFPKALVDDMISVGETEKKREVGDTVDGSDGGDGGVWTLVELSNI